MKRFLYILAGVAMMATAGCTREFTSDLSGGSDERVDGIIREWKNELTSSEYGWFANVMTSQGIYRFWMKFDERDNVTMYTDNLMYPEKKTIAEESSYRIEAYRAPTLIFDSYSYLSILNDPDNSISGGEDNQGLETDFEFEIIDYYDGEFILKGRMNKVPASLTKATQKEYDEVAEGKMMDQLNAIPVYTAGKLLQFEVGAKTVMVILRQRNVTSVVVSGSDARVERIYTYVSMYNNDIVFDTPLVVDNVSFYGLAWDEENSSYELLKSSSGEFRLTEGTIPLVALDKIYGMGKPFSKLRYFNDTELYSSLGTLGTSNPVYSGVGEGGITATLFGGSGLGLIESVLTGGKFNYTDVYFDYADEGDGYKMVLDVNLMAGGRRYAFSYSYTVTFDESDPSLFTVGSTPVYDMNGALLYEEGHIAAMLFGWITPARTFVDAFAGKTFKMDWSSLKYKSEILGELRSVGGGTATVYVGGITE